MLHVVLYQPEIPPNTGNAIRLCANAGARLHLIEPLGFALDDAKLRRAGLDYHEFIRLEVHASLDAFLASAKPARLLAFTTRASNCYSKVAYGPDDALLFGPETRGLPADVLEAIPEQQRLCLPMRPGNRSLNLSNAIAVAVFEAWRQMGFEGAGNAG